LDHQAFGASFNIQKLRAFVGIEKSAEFLRPKANGAIAQDESFNSRDPVLGFNENSGGAGG
jgi:hypothetical protein